MFPDNNQDNPLGDVSGVSLPPQDNSSQPAPSAPPSDDQPHTPQELQHAVHPEQDLGAPEISEHASGGSQSSGTTLSGSDISQLTDIKQQALSQLTPLVGHLDQSPEEKFRTTMMMIQAADDQSLIPQAYEAANAIQDEKVKAQALLDVVNEINYFSQKNS